MTISIGAVVLVWLTQLGEDVASLWPCVWFFLLAGSVLREEFFDCSSEMHGFPSGLLRKFSYLIPDLFSKAQEHDAIPQWFSQFHIGLIPVSFREYHKPQNSHMSWQRESERKAIQISNEMYRGTCRRAEAFQQSHTKTVCLSLFFFFFYSENLLNSQTLELTFNRWSWGVTETLDLDKTEVSAI